MTAPDKPEAGRQDGELVERVARAMWESQHLQAWEEPFRPGVITTECDRQTYREHARAAIAAIVADAKLDRAREALRVFAAAADIRLCGSDDYWTDDKSIQGTDICFHVTFGDLRRARAALADLDAKS